MYQGKPIFYGLGNFIYQANLVGRLPADVFERFSLPADADNETVMAQFEKVAADSYAHSIAGRSPHLFGSGFGVLAQLRLSRRAPPEIRLYPLTLGPERSRALCGYPRLADGPLAEEIIKLLCDLSAPFGTTVVSRDGGAVVVP